MGTNFYWTLSDGRTPLGDELGNELDDMDPRYHIGKRSAAGWYCYDCRVPLVVGGEANVHSGAPAFDTCPMCGQGKDPRGYNAAMVELGLAKTPDAPIRRGVQGASSFSWAQEPEPVLAYCRDHLWQVVVEDEYGDRYTGQQFIHMLDAACPIQFRHSIGAMFC